MEIKKVTKIYFSPANSTNKVIDAIEDGLGVDIIESINLTYLEVRTNFKLKKLFNLIMILVLYLVIKDIHQLN